MSKKVQANISDELFELAFKGKGKVTERLKELIELGIAAESLSGSGEEPRVGLGADAPDPNQIRMFEVDTNGRVSL